MNYILLLVMSSAPFLPESFTMIPFDSLASCEIVLTLARKRWQTVNAASKCIDLVQQKKINEAQELLDKAKSGK